MLFRSDLDGVAFSLTMTGDSAACASGTTANGGLLTLTIPKAKLGNHNGATDTSPTFFSLTISYTPWPSAVRPSILVRLHLYVVMVV